MVAVLDILSVALLLICTVVAAKKGFFKTVIGFLGTFVALGAAILFGDYAAAWLNAKWIGKFFENAVGDYLARFMTQGEGAGNFAEQLELLFDNMPEALSSFLARYSVTPDEVHSVIAGASGGDLQATVTSAIATPLATAVSAAAGFVAVFVIAMLVIAVGTFVVDAVLKLPVLKSLNGAMGIAVGLLEGAVVVMILAGVVSYLAPYLSSYIGRELDAELVNSTLVFKYFYQLTPFKRIL